MQVQEGEGWRLVVDPARQPFCVLAGGEAWAAEFTAAEALALARGAALLVAQHGALADGLMAEEALTLEHAVALEGEGELWLELEGDRRQWCLRFLLTPAPGGRAVEGGWSTAASPALAAALTVLEERGDLRPPPP